MREWEATIVIIEKHRTLRSCPVRFRRRPHKTDRRAEEELRELRRAARFSALRRCRAGLLLDCRMTIRDG